MQRRQLMKLLSVLGSTLASALGFASATKAAQAADAKEAKPAPRADRLTLDEAEWKRRLPAASYEVLRHEGTERPYSSALNAEKRAGIYQCAGCELALFSAAMKFDSGTGWPSFWGTLPGALETRTDFKLILPRTEYHCARCGGHQGHVFDDGPRPTGKRYCNNGVALRFVAETA